MLLDKKEMHVFHNKYDLWKTENMFKSNRLTAGKEKCLPVICDNHKATIQNICRLSGHVNLNPFFYLIQFPLVSELSDLDLDLVQTHSG